MLPRGGDKGAPAEAYKNPYSSSKASSQAATSSSSFRSVYVMVLAQPETVGQKMQLEELQGLRPMLSSDCSPVGEHFRLPRRE